MDIQVYNFINTLQLENYVNQLRINHAKNYLANKVNLRNLSDKDFLAIYTMLSFKDKEKKKKELEEIKKM